jgi:N-acetylmuramoyl-L-alanine amidase
MRPIDTIVLDYGHGGIDKDGNYTTAPSKMAKVNGKWVYEGHWNRIIGGSLHHMLSWNTDHKLKIVETVKANDPRDLSLGHRIRVGNKETNAVFVSIHFNAFDGKARGFEIFTTRKNNNSDVLAEFIADRVDNLPADFQSYKMRFDESDGDKDKEADHAVTKNSIHPAVLVECGFFDNEDDLALFNDEEFRGKFIIALYRGIIDYVEYSKR